jgi:transcriptional regulator with XRE-family HTH domain
MLLDGLKVAGYYEKTPPPKPLRTSMLDTSSPTFREQLKAARKAAGLSGAALSKKIGVSAGMVSRYESDNRNDGVLPGSDTLKKINDILFGNAGAAAPAFSPSPVVSEEELQHIADGLPLSVLIKALKKQGAKEIIF